MRSLTRKAAAMLVLLSVCICIAGGLLIRWFLPGTGFTVTSRQLTEKTASLTDLLRTCTHEEAVQHMRTFERETGAEICLLSAGRIPLDPYTLQPTDSPVPETDTEYPFRFAGETEEYFLLVQAEPVRTAQLRQAALRSAPFLLILILLISLLAAKLFSYWAVRPIRRVSNIAKHMAELDFSWYCPDIRGDEIGVLSRNLNLLSDKLRDALTELNDRNQTLQDEIALEKERERRRMLFLSGVTHELKTPVAIVIGQLEGMQANIGVYRDREKYLARCAEIMQSLNDFIREILLVSHLDMTDASPAPEMDLSEALHTLAAEYTAYAAENGITLQAEIAAEQYVFAEPMLLKKALGNILGNAVTHTGAEGSVQVTLKPDSTGAVLTVENTPAHIGEAHLPHVFEAFYRADPHAKHSSGLGLYITATILDLCKIPYRIENTADSVLFTVTFPKASP